MPVTAAGAMSTPALIWQNLSGIGVQCLVQPTTDANAALQRTLCERVRALALRGAPAPVTMIAQGDPAVLAPGTVTLLVHASAQPAAGGRLVAFSIRPFRVSANGSEILFGAAPRAVLVPKSGAVVPALDAAIGDALAETLPWLATVPGPRPITD